MVGNLFTTFLQNDKIHLHKNSPETHVAKHINLLINFVITGSHTFFLFFFFSPPLLFPRRRSLLDDCFTGQSPGSAISIPAAPDVHEGLGQIQASAP